MKCIAVDDEKLVLELLVDNIRQVPYLQLVKACKNALEAIEVLQKEKIDLIFLDIQMPKLSGLQFIKTLQQPPMVIVITAYEHYALEGYNLNVIDYLLKPVPFERFLKACNKAKELFDLRSNKATSQKEEPDHIFVNVEYTLVKILFSDILFIEGLKDYIKIHLASSSKPVLTKMSLKAIEEKLPVDKFIRIHKSYIVAVDKITVIKRDLINIGNLEIPVSDFYKENLQKVTNR
ncbi:MAG TPA: LytTR family DNA-binding domain-containing protein [Chitinophagaceae bacterium]|jgi:DNA-binding LytR/AlgR family response regulator|nr:LytTR family DNA-binding domain-containing protein [Chitinophagaceae bacterium]